MTLVSLMFMFGSKPYKWNTCARLFSVLVLVLRCMKYYLYNKITQPFQEKIEFVKDSHQHPTVAELVIFIFNDELLHTVFIAVASRLCTGNQYYLPHMALLQQQDPTV